MAIDLSAEAVVVMGAEDVLIEGWGGPPGNCSRGESGAG